MSSLRFAIIFILFSAGAFASPLIAEISDRNIVINTVFDGAELILFGSRNESGEIVAVVRGPSAKAVVRKKHKYFGIWVNRQSEEFSDIPIFYSLAASSNYEEIAQTSYLDFLRIGYNETLDSLRLKKYQLIDEGERAEREEFSHALLRELRLAKLYHGEIAPIKFIGDGLFRANISFPDNTPTGTYGVEVYLINGGQVEAMHTTSIHVYKSGLDAAIYQLSQNNSVIYGLLAIALSAFGGLLAVRIFNK